MEGKVVLLEPLLLLRQILLFFCKLLWFVRCTMKDRVIYKAGDFVGGVMRQLVCLICLFTALLCWGGECQAVSWAGNMGPIMGPDADITSGYGWRIHPVTGEAKFHHGVDISDGIEGTPVYAACDGTIDYAGPSSGFGQHIELGAKDDHYGSLEIVYGHCIPIVGAGTSVTKGQQIGNAYTIGTSTGSHCHLELYINDVETDPGVLFTQYAGASGGVMGPGLSPAATKLTFDAAYKFGEPLKEFSENISKGCIEGLEKLKDAMVYLFIIIITIDLIYGVSMLMIDSEQGNNLFKWLLSKTLMYLILYYIISNWAGSVANFLRDFYVGAASSATGIGIEAAQNAVADPFDVLQKGAHLVAPIIQNLHATDGLILAGLNILAMIILLLLCAIICFQILMAYIEFYMVMLFSFVLFVTSGSKHVRQFAARGFNAVFMVCAKLMFMVFFALMVQNVMSGLQADNLVKQETITVASGGEKEVFDTLRSLGATDAQIAGIMGNIRQEDGTFNPAETNSSGHKGLFQLSPSRWKGLEEYCQSQTPPLNPYSNATQVIYVITIENYNGLGNLLNVIPSSDPVAAAEYFVNEIEVSGESPGEPGYDNRVKYAKDYAARIHGHVLDGATNGMTTSMTVSVMDFVMLCKIIVVLLAFMYIADRISNSLIKGFANGGFKFGND